MPTDFDPDRAVCFSQGRRGEVYAYGGYGYSGRVWSPSTNSWRNVGLAIPRTTVTLTIANPCVVTLTAHGFAGGESVRFFTTGALPTGIESGRDYYVLFVNANTFRISLTKGGTAVVTTGTQSGTHKIERSASAVKSATVKYYVARIDITQNGAGYVLPPPVTISPSGTSPAPQRAASAVARLREGFVSAIEMTDYGKGYETTPEVSLGGSGYYRPSGYGDWFDPTAGGDAAMLLAGAFPVVRAHLRGTYQCYYRFLNEDVPESEGGPIYSNLSPVMEVDCGDGSASLTWSNIPATSDYSVELWRSTANQATTLFRVAKRRKDGTFEFGSLTDDLTDWELIDPARPGFLAMPILLPNGELNANRFDVPPTNYSCAVMFQDRLWMGVDTAGGNANTLRYSEVDEPESMSEVNELILQSNLRATDYITALIPYAGALIVAQSRHCHRLTYVSQPVIDALVTLVAYRGVLNQRCWDIFEGRIYAMDDQGVYSMDPQGNIESLTLGLYDIWQEKIDYSLAEWFSVRVDKRQSLLRVLVAIKEDGSEKFATRMYVYSFDFKTWWEERYPTFLTSATEIRDGNGQIRLVYAAPENNLLALGAGLVDQGVGSISTVTITNAGRGYRTPPTITAAVGTGATFECGLDSDGAITGIVIKTPGHDYANGSLTITPAPGETPQTAATATYTVTTGSVPVYWWYKSGAFEFVSDDDGKRGGETQPRQCSVVYQPTAGSCELSLKTYYNNASYPRSNVARRDRGVGFVHSDQVPAATLNMIASPIQEAESHGVARALFAGNVLADISGNDRHVSIALAGAQNSAGRVVIHSLDVHGVNEKG